MVEPGLIAEHQAAGGAASGKGAAPSAPPTTRARPWPRPQAKHAPEYGLGLLLACLVLALGLTQPHFLGRGNVLLVLEQTATLVIVALPFAMLLLARYIDLSVGSALAVYGVVAAKLMVVFGWSTVLAVVTVLALGKGRPSRIYTGVFDQRLKVIVSSCGLDSYLDYMNGNITGWTSDRYMPKLLSYQARLTEIPFDFHEMIGALAPPPGSARSAGRASAPPATRSMPAAARRGRATPPAPRRASSCRSAAGE